VSSSQRLRDWLLLLACNFIWASQFVMVKIVQQEMGPISATFFPMTLAMLVLIPIVQFERRNTRGKKASIPGRDIFEFLLIGVLGQVVAQLFITWGVRYSLASNAALLMLALPVSTAVMAYIFLNERMTRVRWVSFALAIAGVLECSGIEWKELNLASRRFLLGNVLIFASVNGSAFYNVYSKKMLTRYTPLEVLLYSYYAVFVFLLPITAYAEPEGFRNLLHFSGTVWMGLLGLALFQYCLSMVLFLNVLTRLDATQASLSNYLIPFFGIIIAAVVLHERLTKYMVFGGLLVLTSTLLVTVYEERQRASAQSSVTAKSA
jgi:drug/metabolite transporter (DMT)-like permease